MSTGEEAAGGEDLWGHHQPGRGGGEIQELAETQDQTWGYDHRLGGWEENPKVAESIMQLVCNTASFFPSIPVIKFFFFFFLSFFCQTVCAGRRSSVRSWRRTDARWRVTLLRQAIRFLSCRPRLLSSVPSWLRRKKSSRQLWPGLCKHLRCLPCRLKNINLNSVFRNSSLIIFSWLLPPFKDWGRGCTEEPGPEKDPWVGSSALRAPRGLGAGEAGPRQGRKTPQGSGRRAGGPQDWARGHSGLHCRSARAQVQTLV